MAHPKVILFDKKGNNCKKLFKVGNHFFLTKFNGAIRKIYLIYNTAAPAVKDYIDTSL